VLYMEIGAILEEWTKKEGAFLPHVGLFQG